MSEHVIKVPDIGEGIAEVELVEWHVAVGDTVAEDQALADVMTDKASVEIPSPVAGRVVALGGELGEMLSVGAELIRLELGDQDTGGSAAPAAATPTASPGPSPGASAGAKQGTVVASSEPAHRPAPAPAPPASRSATSPVSPATHSASARPLASPALRARAWELGIDLSAVTPSGTGGRIVMADLDAFIAGGGAAQPARHARQPSGTVAQPATHTQKILGLRRKIAQKMQESKRRIPHYSYVEEIDVEQVMDLREQLNAQWAAQRGTLTPLAFLVRAMVLAAREFPLVNAHFDDEAGVLTRFDAVHMGIATQTDAGLMVPVLRDAQTRDLWSSAAEIGRLAEAARSGKAVRDELTGSTITLTSLGRLGGIVSTPVINMPEVAIVGVNRIAERVVVRGGAVVVRRMMNLSSSFDHRVVDGAYGAGFIQRVRELIEHPAMLFVE